VWNWISFASGLIAASMLIAQDAASSKDKIKNIEALGKQGAGAVPALTAYQRDEDVAVRLATVEAILQAGGAAASEALRTSCLDGSPEIQRLSVAGIVNFYKPGYVKQGVRARIGALGNKIIRAGDDVLIDPFVTARPEDVNAIRKVLRDGASRESKLEAANALATLRARDALEDMVPLLKSKDDPFMLAALRLIQSSGDKASANETVFLIRDLNDNVQGRVMAINGVYRNEAALPDLAEVFARNRSSKSRNGALEAIALIGSPESRGLFEQNLENRDPALRAYAAEGLGRIGAPEQLAKLQELFDAEDSTRARLAQSFALVRLGKHDYGEFSPLRQLFNAMNSAAWGEVATAYLRELSRDESLRAKLRDQVASANRSEKIGIARILGWEGSAEDRATLDALAHDRDPEVAQEGIKAARTLNARLP
jgi:HEAT repeat protein